MIKLLQSTEETVKSVFSEIDSENGKILLQSSARLIQKGIQLQSNPMDINFRFEIMNAASETISLLKETLASDNFSSQNVRPSNVDPNVPIEVNILYTNQESQDLIADNSKSGVLEKKTPNDNSSLAEDEDSWNSLESQLKNLLT